jgi:alkanesulfonate monooxygenase SsuD/methylene tetrahydromethanopterin reductase-like flavin-dependent oxidoreductase (luciferase family)
LEFGVFDHLDHGAGDFGPLYEMRLALIEAYDEAGFRGYHLAEHHATDLGAAPSPGIFLAAAAQRSRRLRLGAMVFCLPLYHPIRLMEEICMLDQMSGGRLDLGIGRGISPIENAYFGIEASEAPAMYREAFDLIKAGLAAGIESADLNFQGARYWVKDMPVTLKPAQRPHPPLWMGVGLPDSAVWPAENGINIISNQAAGRVRAVTDRYREVWAASGGAAAVLPRLGMTRHVVVAETTAEAMAVARRAYMPWRAAFYRLWDRHGSAPVGVSFPMTFEELIEAGQAIAGTPDEVRVAIRTQADQAGINYFLCRFAFGDITLNEARRSVSLFKALMSDHSW